MNPKRQRFVEEYLLDLNATQAAIRAGYSPRTANEQAARLLANVSVRSAIAAGRQAQTQRTQITADYVVTRLKVEAELTGKGAQHSARVRALELLGKHLGLWQDVAAGPSVVVQIIHGIDEEAAVGVHERNGRAGGQPRL